MRIVEASAFQCDLEPLERREDAVQAFVKQETVFVTIRCDDGSVGTGYGYTIGTGGRAVLALLEHDLLPALIGQDASRPESVWHSVFAATRATAPGAVTSNALAAIDLAVWDALGKATGRSLWRMAGGAHDSVALYDTEGGWIHLDAQTVADNAQKAAANGWSGVKVKVGKPNLRDDVERLAAVREAVGPDMAVMVDANQSLTLTEARRRATAFRELDLAWFEEPLPVDDVAGHAVLARDTSIPIAVGETIYSVGQFREYVAAGAVGVVQVDVARIGGVTPFLKVAALAEAFNLPVAPHFLMELHVSLAAAVQNGTWVEHIPQLAPLTTSRVLIEAGRAIPPDRPGLGIDWDLDAIDRLRVK